MSDHRGFLDEPTTETPPTSSAASWERGWIAGPQGKSGPIRHDSVAVLPENNIEDRLTTLSITVIGLISLFAGFVILELGNYAQFDRGPWLGWLTVALLAPGFAAVLWCATQEWRGLAALKAADTVRIGLQSQNLAIARTQADKWLTSIDAPPR